jgi:hypothetical protein
MVIDSIIEATKAEIHDTDYNEYLADDETYQVDLLYELTPFISSKIKHEILYKYEINDFFNRENVSDIYVYDIPNSVVEEVCRLNKEKDEICRIEEEKYTEVEKTTKK